MDPHSLRRDLSAFADGELSPAATRRLLRHMADHPPAAEELRHHQQLTSAARRAVRDLTPPPPDALRDRIRVMADVTATVERRTGLVPSPIKPWWTAFPRAVAAAVLLAIGIWVGERASRPVARVPSPDSEGMAAEVVPAAVVSQAEEIHGVCSRLALGLHSGGYPADVAALATSVEHDLHSDRPYPDLGAIGFRYRGAGPCGRPMADTAHLLYRSISPGSVNAVSVFVQPWHDQYPLVADRLYTVSVAQNGFPMLAWRTDSVVYFLLADNATTEWAALALIRGAARAKS